MNLNEEINRQKQLMGVSESPHNIQNREFGHLSYTDADTIAFGYYKTYSDGGNLEMYLAPQGTHGTGTSSFYSDNLKNKKKPAKYNQKTVDELLYVYSKPRGRLWTNSQLITFWVYPSTQQELLKVLTDIYSEAEAIRKFYPMPSFEIKYIEVPKLNRGEEFPWDTTFILYQPNDIINIEDYDKYRRMN